MPIHYNRRLSRDYSSCVWFLLQIEAIGKFLDGCKAYGMGEKDLFTTLDLYEQTNKNMVGYIANANSSHSAPMV